ncbi:hypothetical protein [Nostoc sp.]|uniref:hypothetical protein n=1 Tax=Nostoc sp. TaxID=1180 RepID=UPI002FF764B2
MASFNLPQVLPIVVRYYFLPHPLLIEANYQLLRLQIYLIKNNSHLKKSLQNVIIKTGGKIDTTSKATIVTITALTTLGCKQISIFANSFF